MVNSSRNPGFGIPPPGIEPTPHAARPGVPHLTDLYAQGFFATVLPLH